MTLAKWYGRETLDGRVYPALCPRCAQKNDGDDLVGFERVDEALWVCHSCNKISSEMTFEQLEQEKQKL